MMLRRRREINPLIPQKKVNPKILELQTAKEILAEIFHARPRDIEDMIRGRLAEKSLKVGQRFPPDKELWPAAFCLGD
jgi:hypothetical protein